jgi:PiT family inorganic phosphate transporter
MLGLSLPVVLLIGLALLSDFLNGFRDGSSLVATAIASRALSSRYALVLTALAEFVGPFAFGVTVASTFGNQVVFSGRLRISVILAALLAGIVWDVVTWIAGLPSSSSHALVGGLVGAALSEDNWAAIQMTGLYKVLVSLAISPVMGLLAGYLVMKVILFLARGATPAINRFFKQSQLLTAIGLALSYGANDGQKTMGVITLGLVVAGVLPVFQVPRWAIVLCATAIAIGTMTGAWRLIRTLGGRLYKLRPVHGFTTQVAATGVILTSAFLGGPVSTTQVVSTAILGVGSAERVSKVHWSVVGHIIVAWLVTIPFNAIAGAAFAMVLKRWM